MGTTKYQHIVIAVGDRIRDGEYPVGVRLPGVVALAREFGVSHITSNRALSELERQGLIRRVERVGSFVRESAGGLSRIHIVVSTAFNEEQVRLFDYWRGISEGAELLGAAVSTIRLSDPHLETELFRLPARRHGIILLGVQDGLLSIRLSRHGATYVHLGANYPDDAPVIMEDRFAACRDLVACMVEDGYRRIAFVGDLSASNHRLARDGYLAATTGLEIGHTLIRDTDDMACAAVVRELLEDPRSADGLVIMGAHLPVSALPAMLDASPTPVLGLLSEDSRALALGRDAYLGYYSQVETGRLAVEVLSGLAEGKQPARRVLTPKYSIHPPGHSPGDHGDTYADT